MAEPKKDKRENALPAVSPTAAIFLGVGAARTLADRGEVRPLKAFLDADALRRKGASEAAIYAATNKALDGTPYAGISYDAASKPRFEISDHDAKLVPSGLDASGRGTMGGFLRHPELYKALPSAERLSVNKGGIQGNAAFDGKTVHLGDRNFADQMLAGRPRARQTVRGPLLHELQHHGQDAGDRPRGASPNDFRAQHPGDSFEAQTRRHLQYGRVAGEVEAEVSRLSANMTPAERRAEHPNARAKRFGLADRRDQIVMDSHGRIVQMADDLRDFGEKIGGARKDRAVKTGPKPKRDVSVDDRPGWAKRFVAAETIDRTTKMGSGQWTLLDTRKKGSFGGHPAATRQTFASKAEAERAIPLLAVSQKHQVRERFNPPAGVKLTAENANQYREFEIWRKVSDKKQVKAVATTFPTREAAMAHMVQNAETLLGTARGYGEEILARPEKVVRSGPAWRAGDVPPEKFMADFRARGVEFGHWQGDRQQVTNMAYDAMRDLADITGIAPESVTLKERLGIAFGARGNGGKQGAAAHYERDFVAINLTKEKGAGHLAHEWMHALDHYLGTVDDPKLAETTLNEHGEKVLKTAGRETDYASHRVAAKSATGQLPDPVREAYRDLIETMTKKPEQVTVEAARYEKQVASAADHLKSEIEAIRRNLATEVPYGKRNTAPATAEQLSRFDEIAAKILAGEGGETKRVLNEGRNGGIAFSARNTNPAVDALSAIMKEVRGRAGWDSQNEQGPMDRLARAMRGVDQAKTLLEQAKASPTRTVMTPTDFAREAAKLDQARTSPYWNTRHEMAARAFSAYIEDKLAAANRQSNYLSFGSENTFYKAFQDVKPFPEGSERAAINQKFDALFAAMKETQVVKPSATVSTGAGMAAATDVHEAMKSSRSPAPPAIPGKGPAGWSDEARAASAEVRAANAKPAEAAIKPGAESYGENKIRADARASILNKDGSGWVVERTSAGWTVQHDGSANTKSGEYPVIPQKPLYEVRNTGNSKRYLIYAADKPVLDSKGQPKWFGSKEKADAFVAKQSSVTPSVTSVTRGTGKTVGNQGEATPSVTRATRGRDAKPLTGKAAIAEHKAAYEHLNSELIARVGEKQAAHYDRMFKSGSGRDLKEGSAAWWKARVRSTGHTLESSMSQVNHFIPPSPQTLSEGGFLGGERLSYTDQSKLAEAEKLVADLKRPRPIETPRSVGDNAPPDLDRLTRAAERLEAVAQRTIEKAKAEVDRPRLMNTARRARMGGGVIEQAQQEIADAKTALKIAEALRRGEAGALSNVKSLADIRELRRLAKQAEWATDRKEGRGWKPGGHGLKADDVGNLGGAKGYVRLTQGDLAEMKSALAGKKGFSDAFRTLERYAQNTSGPDGRTSYETSDSKVFEAVRKVATAIRKSDKLSVEREHQAKMLKYSAGKLLDEVRDFDRAARLAGSDPSARQAALRAFLDVREGKVAPTAAQIAERNLIGVKLPGFFPTPESLAKRMADLADIQKGQMVLEPSAGSGRLADVAKARGATVDAVEYASTLRDVLKAKGHNLVSDDFTTMAPEPKYDRILMNPPFEKGQDMAHVKRAYEMLKPGGKMVAVMGEGGFFRSDSQATEFRAWLDQVRGTSEKLPEGTFKESNTGVNTRLVVIEKPAEIAAKATAAAIEKGTGTGHNRPPFLQGEVLSSQFTNWLMENKGKMPSAEWEAIRKEGRARLVERWQAGRADSVLDFRDLVSRGEDAIAGAKIAAKGENPGWSDAAREASAEVRAANAAPVEPGPAVKAAKANDVQALAKALKTNTTRAADVLKAYKKGRITDAYLEKVTPKPRMVEMADDPRAAERARIANGTKRIGDTYKAPAPTAPSKAESFASSLKPMVAAKVKAALEAQVRHNGKEFLTRAALVERQIAEGAAVQTMKIGGKEQRVLMGKDGAFLDQRAITKAGLDYAEHLSGLRGTQNPNNLAAINENRAANAQPDKSSPAGQKAMWADADRKSRELMRQFSDTQRSDNPLTDAERAKLADKRPQYAFMRPKDAKGNVYETLDDRRQRIVAPNGETVGYTERKQPLKRAVTLGDGRRVGLGQYVGAWKKALAMDPNAPVAGTPSDPRGGGTAGDVVRELRAGMQDRINKHDPAFGKGRKWDSTWQRDAGRLRDTLTRKGEVPKGEAHPVDLRAKIASKLEPGTFIPPKGGDRSKVAQAARNPRYIPGVGVPQQPGMTYKTPPTPTVADLPKGAFKGSEKDFSSLSPGMRREIARTAEKLAAKPKTPQVAPLKGMGPIGFQNETTLNAALKAQGKAASGEAKPVEPAPKAKVAAPKPPKGFDPKRAGMRFLGTSSTMERGLVGVFLGKDGTAYVADAKAAMDTDGRPLGLRQAPAGIQMSAAKAAKDHRFHASAQKAPEDSLARDFKPAAPTVSDLKAEAKAAGIKGASKMTKASLMEALGKNVNRIGMVGMVAAPVAAAMVAYDATKSSAHAAGTDGKTATMQAATAAAVAGGVTAGIGYGIGKGIGLTFKAAAAIAPKVAPMLGPAGVALGVGMMGYGAYHGYQKGGLKGAALGAIGADSLLDLGKTPEAAPATPDGTPRGVDATKASEFEARNTAYSAMQETSRNVVEVNTFARERHTDSGKVVKEVVKAYTRARPNQ